MKRVLSFTIAARLKPETVNSKKVARDFKMEFEEAVKDFKMVRYLLLKNPTMTKKTVWECLQNFFNLEHRQVQQLVVNSDKFNLLWLIVV